MTARRATGTGLIEVHRGLGIGVALLMGATVDPASDSSGNGLRIGGGRARRGLLITGVVHVSTVAATPRRRYPGFLLGRQTLPGRGLIGKRSPQGVPQDSQSI